MKLSRLKKLTWKLLAVYAVLIVLVAAADPSPEKWRRWNFWVALGFVAASTWIRTWAAGHLVKNKVLTVTGPYAYVKNPLYIGTFLGMAGAAFLTMGPPRAPWYHQHLNWIAFGVALLVFVGYYIPYKKRKEGGRLREIFGEAWDHYDRAVPDYFPKFRPYERAERRPWSWAATRENSEHWTPLTAAVGIAAIVWNGWLIDQAMKLVK